MISLLIPSVEKKLNSKWFEKRHEMSGNLLNEH